MTDCSLSCRRWPSTIARPCCRCSTCASSSSNLAESKCDGSWDGGAAARVEVLPAGGGKKPPKSKGSSNEPGKDSVADDGES